MLKLLGLVAILHVVHGTFRAESVVSRNLETTLDTPGFMVTMKNDTSGVLKAVGSTKFANRSERLTALYEGLTRHASEAQGPIITFLNKRNVSFSSLWITNQILIKDLDPMLIKDLEINFGDLILTVETDMVVLLSSPGGNNPNPVIKRSGGDAGMAWGVQKIGAPQAWEYLGVEAAAEGVIVATIDSGVRGSHEALRDNFVGDYGWFDPIEGTPTPTDEFGHGTHTTGTIVGSRGIGVAPNAKWASCRACSYDGECKGSNFLACVQFALCPTLANGSAPDCSKAPHIVSNSWKDGDTGTRHAWHLAMIEAYHIAGIIPIFAIANEGKAGCRSTREPGNLPNVIGVGATTEEDGIAPFSSCGPAPGGRIKPDVTAPGFMVFSASHENDDAYRADNGTSMACPHVAGVVALLLSYDKGLSFEEVKALLFNTTDRDLKFSGARCGGLDDSVFPNNVFGYGRVNASRAVRALLHNRPRRSAVDTETWTGIFITLLSLCGISLFVIIIVAGVYLHKRSGRLRSGNVPPEGSEYNLLELLERDGA